MMKSKVLKENGEKVNAKHYQYKFFLSNKSEPIEYNSTEAVYSYEEVFEKICEKYAIKLSEGNIEKIEMSLVD